MLALTLFSNAKVVYQGNVMKTGAAQLLGSLKADIASFRDSIVTPTTALSDAMKGNFVEAINVALNKFEAVRVFFFSIR